MLPIHSKQLTMEYWKMYVGHVYVIIWLNHFKKWRVRLLKYLYDLWKMFFLNRVLKIVVVHDFTLPASLLNTFREHSLPGVFGHNFSMRLRVHYLLKGGGPFLHKRWSFNVSKKEWSDMIMGICFIRNVLGFCVLLLYRLLAVSRIYSTLLHCRESVI